MEPPEMTAAGTNTPRPAGRNRDGGTFRACPTTTPDPRHRPERPTTVLIFPSPTAQASSVATPTPTAPQAGEVLLGAAEGFAAMALEGAALALHTAAAVLWPVQAAADAVTRVVRSAGAVGDLAPWLPAGVRTVHVEPDLPIEHTGRGAVRRHLTAVPTLDPARRAGHPWRGGRVAGGPRTTPSPGTGGPLG